MKNFMLDIFKAVRILLDGTVTINDSAVPYYVSTFTDQDTGIYISAYSEGENNLKQTYGANVSVTITCFTRTGTPDDAQNMAGQIDDIFKPGKNEVIALDNSSVTILTRSSKAFVPTLQDGQSINQVDLTYNFLIN